MNELNEIFDDGNSISLPLDLNVSSLPGLRGNCLTDGAVIPHPLLLITTVGVVSPTTVGIVVSLPVSVHAISPLRGLIFISVPPRLLDGSIMIIQTSDHPLIDVHSTRTANVSS